MTSARTAGGRHAAPPTHRAAATTGGILLVLTPWLSLGFGTPVAFLVAAVLFGHLGRRHAVILWTATACYTAAVIVMFAEADAPEGATGGLLFTGALLISMIGGGLHALVFTVFAARRGHLPRQPGTRADADRTAPDDPVERPAMAPGARVWLWVLGVALGTLAVGAVGFGTAKLVDDVVFARRHETTAAVVVSVRETRTCLSYQGCTYDRYPTVEFVTARGESVRAETRDFYRGGDQVVGRSTTVHYDPEDPADVRLRSGLDKYDLLAIGYLVVGAGFGVRWLIRRRRAPVPQRAT